MYDCENAAYQGIKRMISESEDCINLIYITPCTYTRNVLLYQLRTKLAEIGFLSNMVCSQTSQTRDITLQELAKYNGKDGNPAYVAVNGIVYDVTNNAAWAAASHFGLTAGKDLTSEFASCHAGQSILNKLKVVGKLE